MGLEVNYKRVSLEIQALGGQAGDVGSQMSELVTFFGRPPRNDTPSR